MPEVPALGDVALTKRTLTIDLASLGFRSAGLVDLAGITCDLTGPGGQSIITDGSERQIVLQTAAQVDTDSDGIAAFEVVPSQLYEPGWPRTYSLAVGSLAAREFEMPDADTTWLSILLAGTRPADDTATPQQLGWIVSATAPDDPLTDLGWWYPPLGILRIWDGTKWARVSGDGEGAAVSAALDHLDDLTADLRPGTPHAGWADTTTDAQGGIAVRSTGGPYDLAAARAATNWARSDDGTADDNWCIRIPTTADPTQARLLLESEAGAASFPLTAAQMTRLGTSADDAWAYFHQGRFFGPGVAGVKMQVTGTVDAGTTSFEGNLNRGKVYAAVKDIVVGGANITSTDDDTQQTVTLAGSPAGSDIVLSDKVPQGPGQGSAGTNDHASRSDHVHPRQTAITSSELAPAVRDRITEGADASSALLNLATEVRTIEAHDWVTTNRIADDAVTSDKIADNSVDVDQLKASGTPNASTYLRGDGEWQTPPGDANVQADWDETDTSSDAYIAHKPAMPDGADGRRIESTNSIYVNAAGPDADPARPQLYAPPQIGGIWTNDGSEAHTGALPVAQGMRMTEVVSVDSRALTHRYAYSFTEQPGTYRVDETPTRIEGFGDAVRGAGARDTPPRTPEMVWDNDSGSRNFNQRNFPATLATWGSTQLVNDVRVTVPLQGPGWVEGIEYELRALRGSVAALDIPANGLVQTHQFPDSSHPRPRSIQLEFRISNNQLAGDHAQKLWFDNSINGAHASLERGPITIEFSSPYLGTVPVVTGNFSGRQSSILVGYSGTATAANYLRMEHFYEDINGSPEDRGQAYFVATDDLAKVVLNCYSKPPNDEVQAHNEGTLSLWTELEGVISRHVVASRLCPEGSRYNLYHTARGVKAGQRFFWTYASHEDQGAISNAAQYGNPQADWDANRSQADPLRTVVIPGLQRSTELLSSPETALSTTPRTLIRHQSRPAPAQNWVALRFQAWASPSVWSWTTVDVTALHRMSPSHVHPIRIGNSGGQGTDPAYLVVTPDNDIVLSGFNGRLLSAELVYWL